MPSNAVQCRAPGRDVDDLHSHVVELVESINSRFRQPGYEPVVWLDRPVPLYERIALYSIAGGWAAGFGCCTCLLGLVWLDLPVPLCERIALYSIGGGWLCGRRELHCI